MAWRTSNRSWKGAMLVLALGLVMTALLPGPAPVQACQNFTDFWTYFSDASQTKVVGHCEQDCFCVPRFCSGRQTPYYIVTTTSGCL
jgi:hypothetical protein